MFISVSKGTEFGIKPCQYWMDLALSTNVPYSLYSYKYWHNLILKSVSVETEAIVCEIGSFPSRNCPIGSCRPLFPFCLAGLHKLSKNGFIFAINHEHRRPMPTGDRCCGSVGARRRDFPRWIHGDWPYDDKRRAVRGNEGGPVEDWEDLFVRNASFRPVWKVFGCWMAMCERDQRVCLSDKQLSQEGALRWSFGCATLQFFRSARFWRVWRGFRVSVSVLAHPGPWWRLSPPGDVDALLTWRVSSVTGGQICYWYPAQYYLVPSEFGTRRIWYPVSILFGTPVQYYLVPTEFGTRFQYYLVPN